MPILPPQTLDSNPNSPQNPPHNKEDRVPHPFRALLACCLCLVAGHVRAEVPFQLNAGQVDYNLETDTITASGGSTVTGQEGTLSADTLTYNTEADLLTATGHVVYTDAQGTTLRVNRLELSGNLKAGTANALRLAVPQLGEVMSASSATRRDDNTYVLKDVDYSPCTECIGDNKPWTIHADRVVYKPDDGEVEYNNAWMDVYGVPVMYLPYFQHPIGPRRPKNGFLFPQFGHSTVYGDEARLSAYAFSPAENADYTFRTRLMSSKGAQLVAERRQVTTHTTSEIKGSYLNDISTGKVRSNLDVVADYTFNPGTRVGLNGGIASDDTYLNDYFEQNDPYLASTVYGEHNTLDRYLALSATRFQDFDPTRSPANTAQVFPHLEYEELIPLSGGTQLTLGADALSLQRGSGNQYRRVVTQANLAKPLNLADGSKLTLNGRLRADLYNVDGTTSDGNVLRALPEVAFNWEKPYISPGGTHTLTPRVMGALSFRGNNPTDIPNEDSVAYELDYANIFQPSRFAGLDRVETGPRLVYGLDNHWGTAEQTRWQLFLGQSLRKYDDNNLPQSGGAATPISDFVGFAQASPNDWISFNSRFRLDNATFDIRRLDNGLQLGTYGDENPWLRMSYSFLDNDTENLNTEGNLPLNDRLRFTMLSRNDLRNNNTLQAEAGLVYRRDCYEIGFKVRRRGYVNGDIQPSTDYLLNIQLLTLGSETD